MFIPTNLFSFKKGTLTIFMMVAAFLFTFSTQAQAPRKSLSSAEIQHQLKQLQVLGTVLYVAAHPDDENTRLIAYMAKGRGYHTTYLSMTRGDGGQNLIGDEKGPLLGVLRTQELLAARRIDGGHQLFSRAYDFGYSKTAEETLNIWERNKALADVVWAIRNVRPDVIITRFLAPEGDKPGLGGHGHHISSAILAKEAFVLAADPKAFPEQLRFVKPWQAKRVLWNGFSWRRSTEEYPNTLKVEVGGYDALLGKNYGEIASLARSQHKCQAFGTSLQRGSNIEKLVHTMGDTATTDFFEGVNTSWERLDGGKKIAKLLAKVYDQYNPEDPSLSIPALANAYRAIGQLQDSHWRTRKQADIQELIAQCAGLWFEANSRNHFIAPGDTAHTKLSIIKRTAFPIQLTRASVGKESVSSASGLILGTNERPLELTHATKMGTVAPSQPYWMQLPVGKGIYQVNRQELIGLPQNPPTETAQFVFSFGTETPLELTFTTPVVHKYVDRAIGELYRPFVVAPRVAVNFGERSYLFAQNKAQRIPVLIKSFAAHAKGQVSFKLPKGWQVSPSLIEFDLEEIGKEMRTLITVTPPDEQSIGVIAARVQENDRPYTSFRQQTIDYDHIPPQMVFDPAEARIVRVKLEKKGELIGYIEGSGDEIPVALEGIGYQVDILDDAAITLDNLKQYDAIIAGIRAYNRRERMPYHHEELMKYVEQGGTYIIQYNTTSGLKMKQPGPYPLTISRDRVSVEEAAIKVLVPEHPVFNSPNVLTELDFENWIQERGLYFPNKWDERYTALMESHDPGETPKQGALLWAPYGRGNFFYTGISFFRELPAGVPGAYRLFANMLSIGKETPETPAVDSKTDQQGE